MKLRTLWNSLKESVKNMARHPLVTLASISTVALMLILTGSFIAVSLNATHMTEVVAKQPTVSIWVDPEVSQENLSKISEAIKSNSEIEEWTMMSPKENFDYLKKELGNESSVLDGYPPEMLPYVFNVKMNAPEKADTFKKQMLAFVGVQDVDYEQKVIDTLGKAVRWVTYVAVLAFAILCVITLFIISNMVRISVLSRAEEINIMKYVGATNAYIRFPYILEGAVTGAVGAVIAWICVRFAYDAILEKLLSSAGGAGGSLSARNLLLPLPSVSWKVLFISLILGIVIGSLGSALSVRRHIKV